MRVKCIWLVLEYHVSNAAVFDNISLVSGHNCQVHEKGFPDFWGPCGYAVYLFLVI